MAFNGTGPSWCLRIGSFHHLCQLIFLPLKFSLEFNLSSFTRFFQLFLLSLSLRINVLIYLNEQLRRDGGWEREVEILQPLTISPNVFNNSQWVSLKPGARNSSWVPDVCDSGFSCFLRQVTGSHTELLGLKPAFHYGRSAPQAVA